MPEDPSPVAELTYEQAREELVALVATLESGRTGLEESMRLWQRGEELAAHCARWLDTAEASLAGDDGTRTGGEDPAQEQS